MQKHDAIFSGRTEKAVYETAKVASHRGNPLIEALPPILEEKRDIVVSLANDVVFDDEMLAASPRIRLHEVDILRQLWIPDASSMMLEGRISTMLRSGYRTRNPRDVDSWYAMLEQARFNLDKAVNSKDGRAKGRPSPRDVVQAHATGLSVVGLSGVGKTTSVKRVLSRYPQVIIHGEDQADFPVSTQIVWLMITCPGDGGVRGLATAILRAFDAVLGTTYHDDFNNKRASADTMRGVAVSLAHLHALGVLVIDEIQVLDRSKSENVDGIMNFLLALMNDLRVPVVVVGASGATKFLSGELQSGRRFSGAGHFSMRPLQEGDELESFVRRIWSKSLLRETPAWVSMSKETRDAILRAIWHMSAGVHDLVVKSFLLGQFRALEIGEESLSPEIFQSVYEQDFAMLHSIIGMMRGQDAIDDGEWDDIRKAFHPAAEDAPIQSIVMKAARTPSVSAVVPAKADVASPAKRVKRRKASPPHREPKKEDPALGKISLEQLRKDGVIGTPVTKRGGDVEE